MASVFKKYRYYFAAGFVLVLFFLFGGFGSEESPPERNPIQKSVDHVETQEPQKTVYVEPEETEPEQIPILGDPEPSFGVIADDPKTQNYKVVFPATPRGVNRGSKTCFNNCQGNGWCFLGRCYCYPGFKGTECSLRWEKEVPLCSISRDHCFVTSYGVAIVSRERWLFAQKTEQQLWSGNQETSDRAGEHIEGFGKYEALPNNLGKILEIGCGPWTQSKFMLEQRKTFEVESITLWEPGLLFYVSNVPTCSFKNGSLGGLSTILVNAGGEQLTLYEEYDTVVLINVLEHVQNIFWILENAFNSLKPGGIFVFNDRYWDNYGFYDVLVGSEHGFYGLDRAFHPIRVKRQVYDYFLSHFETLYESHDAPAFTSRELTGTYFIGRKKAQ
jgi:SAM-dependent methyltransferase